MQQQARHRVAVWDPFVRTFHWSLLLAYAGAWLTAEEWAQAHEGLGWFVVALLGLRLVWGLIGTRHARFSDFVRGPRSTLAYLRTLAGGRPADYLGHNPAGGWMVILLIGSLAATAASGILMAESGHGLWEELHEGLATLSLLLVGVHLAGVIVASLNIKTALLFGVVSQSLTNLIYSWLALSDGTLAGLATAVVIDNIAYGAAGTILIAYMSSLTNTAFTATQYALFSSFYALPGKFVGGFSGFVVEAVGFAWFFAITALIGIPAALLVFFLGKAEKKFAVAPSTDKASDKAAGEGAT